jgi:hypothetical protein
MKIESLRESKQTWADREKSALATLSGDYQQTTIS